MNSRRDFFKSIGVLAAACAVPASVATQKMAHAVCPGALAQHLTAWDVSRGKEFLSMLTYTITPGTDKIVVTGLEQWDARKSIAVGGPDAGDLASLIDGLETLTQPTAPRREE